MLLLIIFIGVILIITYFIFIRTLDIHQNECDKIYEQIPLYTNYKIVKNFLTNQECQDIINQSEQFAYIHGWQLKRHNDYPTTDNEITKEWKIYNYLVNKIEVELFPLFENLYHLKKNKLTIDELFVAKYSGGDLNVQNELKPHEDGSEFSFIIALNDGYIGGGTHFVKQNKTVHLNTGDVVIFCGQTKHAGLPVTEGKRYILPGFIYYGKCYQHNR